MSKILKRIGIVIATFFIALVLIGMGIAGATSDNLIIFIAGVFVLPLWTYMDVLDPMWRYFIHLNVNN